ncbi:MAG: hypothetical protein V7K47_08565 [Nostoc sp.]
MFISLTETEEARLSGGKNIIRRGKPGKVIVKGDQLTPELFESTEGFVDVLSLDDLSLDDLSLDDLSLDDLFEL